MSKNTKYTPEDDETRRQVEVIGQTMEALVKLLERNGRKVATLSVEFESGPDQHIDQHSEDDSAAGADEIEAPDRNEDPPH